MCFSRARVLHLKDAMTTRKLNRSDLDQKITDGRMHKNTEDPRASWGSRCVWIFVDILNVFDTKNKKTVCQNKKRNCLSILSPKPRRDFWWKSWDVEMMPRPLSLSSLLFLSLLFLSLSSSLLSPLSSSLLLFYLLLSLLLSSVKLSGSNRTWRGEWQLVRGRSRWNASSRG